LQRGLPQTITGMVFAVEPMPEDALALAWYKLLFALPKTSTKTLSNAGRLDDAAHLEETRDRINKTPGIIGGEGAGGLGK